MSRKKIVHFMFVFFFHLNINLIMLYKNELKEKTQLRERHQAGRAIGPKRFVIVYCVQFYAL